MVHHESEDDLDDTQDCAAGGIHLIENPDLPSLSFDVISSSGDIVDSSDEDRIKKQKIPEFMDKHELEKHQASKSGGNWMQRRNEEYGDGDTLW